MKERLFFISAMLGLGAVAMTLILFLVGPRRIGPLPPGFLTPVLAFEFARDPGEVYRMFQPAGSVAAMDRLNRWDFLYMGLYSLFLGTFALAAARETGRRLLYVAAGLALLIWAADALENVQLLGLTYGTTLDGGSLENWLARLRIYTWLKWGGLALYFLLLVPYFRGQTGFGRWIAGLALLPAILAVAAFIRRGPANELLALSVGLMFLLLTIYSLGQGMVPRRRLRGTSAGHQA